MRKMLVITRDGSRSEDVGNLLNKNDDILTETALESSAPGDDREVDTLFVDVESLLGKSKSINKALKGLWSHYPSAAIVVMADEEQTNIAVDAVKAGAFDYLTHPIGKDELDLVMDKVRESDVLQSELDYLRGHFWDEESLEYVDTSSKVMRDVFAKIRQVAGTRTTVLLTGETGTGKSLIAKLLHSHSNRKNMPFINVHCGAIPDTLVESELFGHEKGAFTGAIRRKLGKFELAHGGTIFLDEIGTVSQSVQVKLLNVIQERIIQRVGGENDISVDVRIIAATNEDMGLLCEKGKFRRDLFYRLNVFPVRIPLFGNERMTSPDWPKVLLTNSMAFLILKSKVFIPKFWIRSLSTIGQAMCVNWRMSLNAPAFLKQGMYCCLTAFRPTYLIRREKSLRLQLKPAFLSKRPDRSLWTSLRSNISQASLSNVMV